MLKRQVFFLQQEVEKASHLYIPLLKLSNIATENNKVKLKYLALLGHKTR